jgi:formylglycine-generating enzyme required for sulfatase activity
VSLRGFLIASCLMTPLAANPSSAQPPKPKDGPLGMKFVPLPKATFYMGGGPGKATSKTEIKKNFEIAVSTVTQEQWQAVMGNNPSEFSRNGKRKDQVKDISDADLKLFPVEMVSWNDAQAFIKKLNEKETGRGYVYRLPSDAEWEYACKGGATSVEECSFDFYLEKSTNDLSSKQANFDGNFPSGKADKGPYLARSTKVGSYAPNKLGLYDMHGNVWQWCADFIADNVTARALRGGSWHYRGEDCWASFARGYPEHVRSSDIGFRLVRVPVESK